MSAPLPTLTSVLELSDCCPCGPVGVCCDDPPPEPTEATTYATWWACYGCQDEDENPITSGLVYGWEAYWSSGDFGSPPVLVPDGDAPTLDDAGFASCPAILFAGEPKIDDPPSIGPGGFGGWNLGRSATPWLSLAFVPDAHDYSLILPGTGSGAEVIWYVYEDGTDLIVTNEDLSSQYTVPAPSLNELHVLSLYLGQDGVVDPDECRLDGVTFAAGLLWGVAAVVENTYIANITDGDSGVAVIAFDALWENIL